MRKLTGTVSVTDDGKYRVRLKGKTLGTFEDPVDADNVRRAALEHLAAQDRTSGDTLRDYGEHVLALRDAAHAAGKLADPDSDRSRWLCHVVGNPEKNLAADEIASIGLSSIRTHHIEDWIERLEAKALGDQTRRNCLNVLRVIFRHAVKKRKVKSNPTIGIRIASDDRRERWSYLTTDEQRSLVEVARRIGGSSVACIIAFAIGTGLRAGELCTLRLVDVHADGSDPHVMVKYGTAPDSPPKYGRVRKVGLFGVALEAVRLWLRELPRFAPKNPHGLLFPLERGGFRSHRHVIPWRTWKGFAAKGKRPAVPGALELAGVTREFHWHDLRHTCASSLVSGWWGRRWSLLEVCQFLGHGDITTTQRYAHLAPEAADRAVAETTGPAQSVFAGSASGHFESGESVRSSRKYRATLGNRTRDLRFTKPASAEVNSEEVSSAYGVAPDSFGTLSRALLEAVAAGHSALAARVSGELSALVLAEPEVKLATLVAAGGPLAIAHAIDLARRLLGDEAAAKSSVA